MDLYHINDGPHRPDGSITTLTTDLTAPTVVSTVPANNATNIAIASAIIATLSEPLDAATVTGTNVLLQSGALTVPATLSYTAGSTTITLTPSSPLGYNITYTATLKGGATGIKDVAGNALASDYAWNFTTEAAPDLAAPTVVSTVPANNAINIAIASAITATVSEPLDAATVNGTSVLLQAGASSIAATVAYTAGSTLCHGRLHGRQHAADPDTIDTVELQHRLYRHPQRRRDGYQGRGRQRPGIRLCLELHHRSSA